MIERGRGREDPRFFLGLLLRGVRVCLGDCGAGEEGVPGGGAVRVDCGDDGDVVLEFVEVAFCGGYGVVQGVL